jgi:hypothetical protein
LSRISLVVLKRRVYRFTTPCDPGIVLGAAFDEGVALAWVGREQAHAFSKAGKSFTTVRFAAKRTNWTPVGHLYPERIAPSDTD